MMPITFATILIVKESMLVMAAAHWVKSMSKAIRLARSNSTPTRNHSSLRKTLLARITTVKGARTGFFPPNLTAYFWPCAARGPNRLRFACLRRSVSHVARDRS